METKTYRVTYKTPMNTEIVEVFDMSIHENGFQPDYKLRAMALGWKIKSIEELRVVV